MTKQNKLTKKTQEDLLKHEHKMGFTNQELINLCRKLKINKSKFNEAFGVNTCGLVNGKAIFYKCDVERALYKLGHSLGKNYLWD